MKTWQEEDRPRTGEGVYHDPLYGHVPLPPRVRQLIDLPTFQRLRRIRQLATIELALPGATHTRFEHSVGTYFLATRAYDVLLDKSVDMTSTPPERRPPKGQSPPILSPHVRLALQLAALLHDVGHGPYSHVFDLFLEHNQNRVPRQHEIITGMIIRGELPDNTDIAEFISDLFASEGRPDILSNESIASLAIGHCPVVKDRSGLYRHLTDYRFLAEIISCPWGVDRLDYLRRDAIHTGIETGRLDIWKLIQSYTFRKAPLLNRDIGLREDREAPVVDPNGQPYLAWKLALEMDAAPWLEAMLNTRELCYRLIYFSDVNRIAVEMLFRAIQERFETEWRAKRSKEEQDRLWEEMWRKDDAELLTWLRAADASAVSRSLANRISSRKLYVQLPVDLVPAPLGGGVDADTVDTPPSVFPIALGGAQAARLTFPPEEYTRRVLLREPEAARATGVYGSGDTVIIDVHFPPFEGRDTFIEKWLYDEREDEFYSLVEVAPHLRLSKVGIQLGDRKVDPDWLYGQWMRSIRVYTPYALIVGAVERGLDDFLRAGNRTPFAAAKESLSAPIEAICNELAGALDLDELAVQRLRARVKRNVEYTVCEILRDPRVKLRHVRSFLRSCPTLEPGEFEQLDLFLCLLLRRRRPYPSWDSPPFERAVLRGALQRIRDIAQMRPWEIVGGDASKEAAAIMQGG